MTTFVERSIKDVWQGSEYAFDSECVTVLNIPDFWIYHGSEDASGSEYTRVRVFNMQCSGYAWIIPEYAWLCLNISEYGWIC